MRSEILLSPWEILYLSREIQTRELARQYVGDVYHHAEGRLCPCCNIAMVDARLKSFINLCRQ